MHYICNYIPEANHISTEHSDASVLYLQFVLHVMLFRILNVLYFDISTFRSVCAVPNMAVFCSSLISCFPGVLFRYCLSDFEMVPLAPVTAAITFAFMVYMRSITSVRSLYFKVISVSFPITLFSSEIPAPINTCFFFIITVYDVRFIVVDGSVGSHFLFPKYGYPTFMTCFY